MDARKRQFTLMSCKFENVIFLPNEKHKKMNKPIIVEQYADNGEFSHWHLIKVETGEVLWSSFPEETIAQGQKIISSNLPVIKSVNEQQPQPFQTDIIIRFSKLPRKGLIADFSGVGLNQLVEFNTYDFHDLIIFDMQLEHINARAKELNANFVVYHMGSSDLLKSNTYMMKFTK